MQRRTIGIDFGTCWTTVAVMRDGQPEVIPNSEGEAATSSVVARADGAWLTGTPARNLALRDPRNSAFSFKQFIGRKFTDSAQERQDYSFPIEDAGDGGIRIALAQLRENVETSKETLSTWRESTVTVPYIAWKGDQPRHLVMRLTRGQLANLTGDLLEGTRDCFEAVLREAGIARDELGTVLPVGRSTRMPGVVELIRSLGNVETSLRGWRPEATVALGAAIQAGRLEPQS